MALTCCVNPTVPPVDIYFRSNKLRKVCSQQKVGIKTLGPESARKLRTRMADLEAAPTLEHLRNVPGAGRLHELTGDRKGLLSLDLKHPYRLLFIPADDPPPTKPDGGLDWSQITSVTIIDIEDTHG